MGRTNEFFNSSYGKYEMKQSFKVTKN